MPASFHCSTSSTTPPPTLEQISPYREALVVSEYEVRAVEAGRLQAECNANRL